MEKYRKWHRGQRVLKLERPNTKEGIGLEIGLLNKNKVVRLHEEILNHWFIELHSLQEDYSRNHLFSTT